MLVQRCHCKSTGQTPMKPKRNIKLGASSVASHSHLPLPPKAPWARPDMWGLLPAVVPGLKMLWGRAVRLGSWRRMTGRFWGCSECRYLMLFAASVGACKHASMWTPEASGKLLFRTLNYPNFLNYIQRSPQLSVWVSNPIQNGVQQMLSCLTGMAFGFLCLMVLL